VASGLTLGLGGAALITYGQIPFLALIIFIAFQATKEYYAFITSKGIAKGMEPPPPLVSVTTTVLCTSIALLAYLTQGKSGVVLAITSFILLIMEVLTIKRPKFAQLTSSVFGLFYCG
jgi:phosphatidate cytidylyltransferase